MKKNFKRFFGLILCFALMLGLTACRRVNERALYIGEEDFSAGFYSCALVFADMEGQQKVYDTLGEEAAANYLNQTLDGVDYKTWVKNRAIETCKEFAVFKGICEELMLNTDKYSNEFLETADLYWEYYGYSEMMMENGVGRGTFRSYIGIDAYRNTYFDFIYGEGGKKEIPADEITANLAENYIIANIINEDLTGKTEAEVKELTEKLEGYAKRIREGEKFEKIYSEATGTTYTEDANVKDTFSYNLATVLGSDKTVYTSDLFSDAAAMKNGEVKLITKVANEGTEGETTTLYLVFKADVLGEANTKLDDLKSAVRHYLKDEEFEKDLKSTTDNLTVEINEKVTKQFKVEKIKYPQ